MELQMATIDPYLEIFEESERKEIKKTLVDRIFTGVEQTKEDGDKRDTGQSILDLTKLIGTITNAVKK